jgi:hypothetical protein
MRFARPPTADAVGLLSLPWNQPLGARVAVDVSVRSRSAGPHRFELTPLLTCTTLREPR